MPKTKDPTFYSPTEERLNIWSHGLGFVASVLALILLVLRANGLGTPMHLISFVVFGISLCVLYAASTLYHSAQEPKRRFRLKVFDHAAIYVLIAGTYTPFTLITLKGSLGWTIFAIVWGCAFVGIVLKLFFTGRFNLISTIMYVLMGWIIVFAIKPLIAVFPHEGLLWMLAGGLSYTIGAILYSIERIPFNHAIFHFFVLGGSFCHFLAVYWYVS